MRCDIELKTCITHDMFNLLDKGTKGNIGNGRNDNCHCRASPGSKLTGNFVVHITKFINGTLNFMAGIGFYLVWMTYIK